VRALTLEYHDVVTVDSKASGFTTPAALSYKISRARFKDHLDVLVQLRPARDSVHGLDAIPPSTGLLLSFDDGGVSAAREVPDLLEPHGFVGHFFMTTSQIGSAGFCSSSQLRSLRARGHVIGSHSHTHPRRMSILTDAQLEAEWRTSIEILQDVLGETVDTASVPGGYFSARVAKVAAECGIRWLFTSEPVTRVQAVHGCRVLGRFTLRTWSTREDVQSLVGRVGLARRRQWVLWNVKKVGKVLGGERYLKMRSSLLRSVRTD
jgi:peptidoglycan/xylan/chitin deacetylase (PgdA/CDA1 family)